MILPRVIINWNALKGGVDEYSSRMKSFARANVSESPIVTIIGRLLSTQVSNAGLVPSMALAEELGRFRADVDALPDHRTGYRQLRKLISSCQTADHFVCRLAEDWIAKRIGTPVLDNLQNHLGERENIIVPWFPRNAVLEYNKMNNRARRLGDAGGHERISAQATYCTLCGFTFMYRKKSLHTGSRQNKWCQTCLQALCDSCWEEWQTEPRLVKKKPSRARI
ncbi:unnamed protein product [Agarophyton chilense]